MKESVHLEPIEMVENLIEGVVPERSEEVKAWFTKYAQNIRSIPDIEGYSLEAGPYGIIQYTERSMAQLWLFAFSGRFAMEAYLFDIDLMAKQSVAINLDPNKFSSSRLAIESEIANCYELIEKLNKSRFIEDFVWPKAIPHPNSGRPKDVRWQSVFELACFAAGTAFFHELKHIIFAEEGNAPSCKVEEEMECDKFAIHMLLDEVDSYSELESQDANKVKDFRLMGALLAACFIAFMTSKKNRAGSSTHPSIKARVTQFASHIDEVGNEYSWKYLSSMLLALSNHLELDIGELKYDSAQELGKYLISVIPD